MNSFLPTNYDIPDKSTSYMKLVAGVNHFRILDAPIMGYETWVEEEDKRRPLRFRMDEAIPATYRDSVKHFWAMPVYNYKDNKIQILELTQKTIMRALRGLANDPDWGSPLDYDLVITRTGEDLQSTEYTVQPKPKKPLEGSVVDMWAKLTLDLDAFYSNGDPFAGPTVVETAEGNVDITKVPF